MVSLSTTSGLDELSSQRSVPLLPEDVARIWAALHVLCRKNRGHLSFLLSLNPSIPPRQRLCYDLPQCVLEQLGYSSDSS